MAQPRGPLGKNTGFGKNRALRQRVLQCRTAFDPKQTLSKLVLGKQFYNTMWRICPEETLMVLKGYSSSVFASRKQSVFILLQCCFNIMRICTNFLR